MEGGEKVGEKIWKSLVEMVGKLKSEKVLVRFPLVFHWVFPWVCRKISTLAIDFLLDFLNLVAEGEIKF